MKPDISSSWSAPITSTAWTSSQMIKAHIASGRRVTGAAIRQPISLATDQFGVIELDPTDPTRIAQFLEAEECGQFPQTPPDEVLASMSASSSMPTSSSTLCCVMGAHRRP
jgi:hypothetical protein